MKADSIFPFDLHWDSQALTDAVPLRLFEVSSFGAPQDATSRNDARLQPPPVARRWREGYVARSALPATIRVR